jgi:hypothetical protein
VSLDWNTEDCPGNKETAGWVNEKIHPDTNSLAWGAFCGVHLGYLDTKNIDEWIWRVEFLKLVHKPWMSDGSFPTPEAMDNHLGFRTNCDSKTRKQWLAFITRCLSDEVSRSIDKMYKSEECVDGIIV